MIRILVADDHELVRKGLVSVLEKFHADWTVVAEAADGKQAIELGLELRPDVAVVDLSMPEANGLMVTEQLCAAIPGIKVLVLTVHSAEPVIRQARRAGARAFLPKKEAPTNLVKAVERMLEGPPAFIPPAAGGADSPGEAEERTPVQYLLTPREMDVLKLLASGMSNKEVASALEMSVRTAESHRADIMARLDVESLGELVRIAIRDGVA